MAKPLFPILLALSTPLLAQSVQAPANRAPTRAVQLARLQQQQQVLAEEMGRLQLDMLVSDIVAPARKPVGARPQLTLATIDR